MLIETELSAYYEIFPAEVNPFITKGFIELNQGKAERILTLIDNQDKPGLGLVAGIQQDVLKSPFSAPFGGFHFKSDNLFSGKIDAFVQKLSEYIISQNLKGFDLIFPPDIYHQTFNAKVANALVRAGFAQSVPDITNWVDLNNFSGSFKQKNSRECFRQAVRNGLSFTSVDNREEMEGVYDLIRLNRKRFGRPIYMSLKDILQVKGLWPVDFFKICSPDGSLVASAIFYRFHPDVAYAVFWGDNPKGRSLKAMDFLALHLYDFYKDKGFRYIDLGISTENGVPNEGLLRFKESHDATSSVRFNFSYRVNG